MNNDYVLRSLNDIKNCSHEKAQFYGMYSLVGYYYCDECMSKFCPQEFQAQPRLSRFTVGVEDSLQILEKLNTWARPEKSRNQGINR